MKVGDTVPVTIAGQVVAQASVKALENNTVTLIVPATAVVMAVRTEIAPDPVERDTTGTETLITGVERSTGAVAPEQKPEAQAVPSAPVGEAATPPTVESSTDESTPKTLPEPSAPAPPVDSPNTTVETPSE